MKRFLSLLAVGAVSVAAASDATAQNRNFGAERLLLDDNAGRRITLQVPHPMTGNATYTFPQWAGITTADVVLSEGPQTLNGQYVFTDPITINTDGGPNLAPNNLIIDESSLSRTGNIAVNPGAGAFLTTDGGVTQTGAANQNTFNGNVDATNGLDVTGAPLTANANATLTGAVDINFTGAGVTRIGSAAGGNVTIGVDDNTTDLSLTGIINDAAPTRIVTLNAGNNVRTSNFSDLADEGVSWDPVQFQFELGGQTNLQVPFTANPRWVNIDASTLNFSSNGGLLTPFQITGGPAPTINSVGVTNINTGTSNSATNINNGTGTGAVGIGNLATTSVTVLGPTSINANNATGDVVDINTGTSTGATNIGSATAGAITGQSASTINLTAATGSTINGGTTATLTSLNNTTVSATAAGGDATLSAVDDATISASDVIVNGAATAAITSPLATINTTGAGVTNIGNIAGGDVTITVNDNTTNLRLVGIIDDAVPTHMLTKVNGTNEVRATDLSGTANQGIVFTAGEYLLGATDGVTNPFLVDRNVNIDANDLTITRNGGAENAIVFNGGAAGSVDINSGTGNVNVGNATGTNTFEGQNHFDGTGIGANPVILVDNVPVGQYGIRVNVTGATNGIKVDNASGLGTGIDVDPFATGINVDANVIGINLTGLAPISVQANGLITTTGNINADGTATIGAGNEVIIGTSALNDIDVADGTINTADGLDINGNFTVDPAGNTWNNGALDVNGVTSLNGAVNLGNGGDLITLNSNAAPDATLAENGLTTNDAGTTTFAFENAGAGTMHVGIGTTSPTGQLANTNNNPLFGPFGVASGALNWEGNGVGYAAIVNQVSNAANANGLGINLGGNDAGSYALNVQTFFTGTVLGAMGDGRVHGLNWNILPAGAADFAGTVTAGAANNTVIGGGPLDDISGGDGTVNLSQALNVANNFDNSGNANIATAAASTTNIGSATGGNVTIAVTPADASNLILTGIESDATPTTMLTLNATNEVKATPLAGTADQGVVFTAGQYLLGSTLTNGAGSNPFLADRNINIDANDLTVTRNNGAENAIVFNGGATGSVDVNTGSGNVNLGNAAGTNSVMGSTNVDGATTINDAANFNTSINTTGSTGTVTIGNTAAGGAVTIASNGDILVDPNANNLNVNGHILPVADETYDLGATGTDRWRALYLTGQSLHIQANNGDAGGYTATNHWRQGIATGAGGELIINANAGPTEFTFTPGGAFSALGDVTAAGALNGNTLNVTSTGTVGGLLTTNGVSNTGTITSTGDITSSTNVNAVDVNASGDVTAAGALNGNTLAVTTTGTVGGLLTTNGVSNTGTITSTGDITSSTNVNAVDVNASGDVTAAGALNGNTLAVTTTGTVGGLLTTNGVSNTGTITSTGDITSSTNVNAVDVNASGDVTAAGALNGNTLAVTTTGTVGGLLTTNGVSNTGTITSTGDITSSTNVNAVDVNASGDVTAAGALNGNTLAVTTTGTVGGLLTTNGVSNTGTITSTGDITSSTNVNAVDVNASGDVTAAGALNGNTLAVTTTGTVGGLLTTNGVSNTGTITSTGAITSPAAGHALGTVGADAVVLTVNGLANTANYEIEVVGDIRATGDGNFGSLTMNGDLDMAGNDINNVLMVRPPADNTGSVGTLAMRFANFNAGPGSVHVISKAAGPEIGYLDRDFALGIETTGEFSIAEGGNDILTLTAAGSLVTDAGITASAGDVTATAGDVVAGDDVAATDAVTAGGSITAGTTITAGTGLTVTAGGANIDGPIVQTGLGPNMFGANLNMQSNNITNIGDPGTDFNGTGGLTLADQLVVTNNGINVTGDPIINIGDAGTDFDNAGGLTIAGTGTLTANGNTVLGNAGADVVTVNGAATFNNNAVTINSGGAADLTIAEGALTRAGNIAINPGAANALSTNGAFNVAGNTALAGTLAVTGTTALNNNTTITGTLGVSGAATANSLGIANAATVGGTLGVTGNTTLGGTLNVASTTTLGAALGVTGNTTIGGTLGVTGNTSLTTLSASGASTFSSTLGVAGAINGSAAGNSIGAGTNATQLTISGAVGGLATDLNVIGDATITGNATLGGLIFAGDLDMNGNDIIDLSDIAFSGVAGNITTAAGGNLSINTNTGDLSLTSDDFSITSANGISVSTAGVITNAGAVVEILEDVTLGSGASTIILDGAVDATNAGNQLGDGADVAQLTIDGVPNAVGGAIVNDLDVDGDIAASGTVTAQNLAGAGANRFSERRVIDGTGAAGTTHIIANTNVTLNSVIIVTYEDPSAAPYTFQHPFIIGRNPGTSFTIELAAQPAADHVLNYIIINP